MNIENEIREYILSDLLFDRQGLFISNDEEILEKKIIDSMALVQLISFIEEQYGISIEDEDLVIENFRSISHIRNFILRKKDNAS